MGGVVELLWRVKAPDAKNPDGGYVPVSNSDPLPVHTSALQLARTGSFAGGYARVGPGQTVGLGALGDYLTSVLVIPGTNPGAVTLSDGATSFPLWPGGPLTDHRPFKVDIGAYSRNGPWTVTTGQNVAVLATGSFD